MLAQRFHLSLARYHAPRTRCQGQRRRGKDLRPDEPPLGCVHRVVAVAAVIRSSRVDLRVARLGVADVGPAEPAARLLLRLLDLRHQKRHDATRITHPGWDGRPRRV